MKKIFKFLVVITVFNLCAMLVVSLIMGAIKGWHSPITQWFGYWGEIFLFALIPLCISGVASYRREIIYGIQSFINE